MSKDYYERLGVPRTASQDEIKKAFRKLAHEHHPDKGNGNADKFKEINEAYQTLGNEQKRKQYDQFGQAGPAGGFNYQDFGRSQGGNPFGQGGFSQQGGGVHFDFGGIDDLGDIFGSFFGGGQSRQTRRQARGHDVEVELSVDFEDAVFGVEKTIDLAKLVICDDCGGTGADAGAKISNCLACGGTGRVSQTQQTILGAFETQSLCRECEGEGKKPEKKCARCHGRGVAHGSEKIKVRIPAGIEDGQAIKLSGKGEPEPKGAAGDLYIRIKVQPSRKFQRQKDNIFSEQRIAIKQAILGDKIEVETVDGPVSLKIPAGTQSHTEFRLRDKGVPHLHSRGRGDHLVKVIVDIPDSLSRKDKKILDDLDI